MKIPQICNPGHDEHTKTKQKPNSHKERPNKTQINWELIEKNKKLINNNNIKRQDWGFPPVKADGSPSDGWQRRLLGF